MLINKLKKLIILILMINISQIYTQNITFKFTNRSCKGVNVKIYHEPNAYVAEFGGSGVKQALDIQSGISGRSADTAVLPQINKIEVCDVDGTGCVTTTAKALVGEDYIRSQKNFIIKGNKRVELEN